MNNIYFPVEVYSFWDVAILSLPSCVILLRCLLGHGRNQFIELVTVYMLSI